MIRFLEALGTLLIVVPFTIFTLLPFGGMYVSYLIVKWLIGG